MLNPLRKPFPGKELIRDTIVEPLRQFSADRKLDRAIDDLRRGGKDLQALKRGWRNEGFEGDVRFLEETWARTPGKCILECGSGLTTIIAAARGGEVWCLEQHAEWAEKVSKVLRRNNLTANILVAPLKQYDGYVWYDLTGATIPSAFDLVICDGPYVSAELGADYHKAWRYGVLPQLKNRGVHVKEMLIDDLDEPRAVPVLDRWVREFGLTYEAIRSASGDFAIAKL